MALRIDDVLGSGSPLARRLPGYETREGQLEMAKAVQVALEQDGHLFVEAGTGTGKTFAYLVPAILSGRKIVVSTATHALQEQIFEKDIPFVGEVLAEHGIELKAALMKGLSNYVCKRRFHERLRSGEPVGAELAQIERWALASETGDRAELVTLTDSSPAWRDVQSGTDTRIGAGCKYHDECFVTRMRREAEEAQIIVVNHHLFFADLALKSGRNGYGGAIPQYDAVIFDEAHQIESVATDFFGVRLSAARLTRLVGDARRAVLSAKILDAQSMRILDNVDSAAHAFFQGWRTMARGGDDARRLLAPSDWTLVRKDAASRLDLALQATVALSLAFDESDAMAMIARRAGELRTDLARVQASAQEKAKKEPEQHWEPEEDDIFADLDDVGAGPRSWKSSPPGAPARGDENKALLQRRAIGGFEGGIAWVDARERSISLGASPVDLAPILREKLFDRIASVICTSATLTTATHSGPSFHFAKGRLGARPDTAELVVASPFDFAARAALYIAEDLPEPNAPGFDEACAVRARELAIITGGGAFVLCTSTRAMRAIHASFVRAPDPRIGEILVQGEAPKHVLLERFRAAGNAVLVATMSFWEGVDVPGHALRLVVIDKIPFAVPTEPIVAARSAMIEAEGGNPFTQYSVPAAAITLKQGFGRLIRTKRDAGIVALLDKRARRRGYGRALLESLPPARRVASVEAVRDFWQSIE